MPSVSCIVPAYNEAPRIGAVLEAAAGQAMIGEVLVVDDGSGDGTAEVAEEVAAGRPGIRVIGMPQNGGKARAVARGIEAAKGDLVLFLDADLIGLEAADLGRLIAPVAAGRADVALSLRRNAPWPWRAIGLDYISGERVMQRRLFAGRLDEVRALPGFGLEVYMNRLWLAERARIAVVRWDGVASPLKARKQGGRAGVLADLGMIRDIFGTVGPIEVLRQILAMRAHRVPAE